MCMARKAVDKKRIIQVLIEGFYDKNKTILVCIASNRRRYVRVISLTN